MSLVLDHSVALAWCFEDEQTSAIMAVLDRVAETGAMAPSSWPLEALNGLLAAERRRRIDAARRMVLIALLRDLPIVLDDETAVRSWSATATLAERHRLTLYDSTYLELAIRRRLPLATHDRDLRRAAASEGVEVMGAA